MRSALPWAIALGMATSLLLAMSTLARLDREGDVWANQPKRFWEDIGLATGLYLTGEFPVSYNPFRKERGADGPRYTEARDVLAPAVRELGIAPWQFWRSVPDERVSRRQPPPVFRRFDDAGRALLLGIGYRLLGGVAPYLVFWLLWLVATPVLVWLALELLLAARPIGALLVCLSLGASAFLAEILALTYAGIGFYAIGVILLAVVGTGFSLAPLSLRSGSVRALLAGSLFGLCVVGRSSVLLLTPGFLLAFAFGAWRLGGGRRRSALTTVAWLGLLLAPYGAGQVALSRWTARTLAARSAEPVPQLHPIWWNLWMGLGDFDREKGYVWSDQVASEVAVKHGGVPIGPSFLDPIDEPILRDLMLGDIRADPTWYLEILGRRLVATVLQVKLWPWRPLDGRSIEPASHPNEGVIDSYYSLTTPIDTFSISRWRFELPISILLAPTFALLAVGLTARGRHHRRLAMPPLSVAAGTLVLPVVITTAGGLETQAFALTYLLGAGLALDALARSRALRQGTPGTAPALR